MDIEESLQKIENNTAILYLIAAAVDNGTYFKDQLTKALLEVCDALEEANQYIEEYIANQDEAL